MYQMLERISHGKFSKVIKLDYRSKKHYVWEFSTRMMNDFNQLE